MAYGLWLMVMADGTAPSSIAMSHEPSAMILS
jgi:hypothetical protein